MSSTPQHDTDCCQAALEYAKRGWPVLPLHSIRNGRCTCERADCASPGKHPLTEHGFKDATTEAETIQGWWECWPWANVGIVTGKTSGLVVLDLDRHGRDQDGIAAAREAFGWEPEGVYQETGGGGLQAFYRRPELPVCKNRSGPGAMAPGVEAKADGGYVVVPPSLHASGERYRWADGPEDAPLPPCPDWLVEELRDRDTSTPASARKADRSYVLRKGKRNDGLTRLAGKLRRHGLGAESLEAALLSENTRLCKPPLPEPEVRKIARSVARYPEGEQPSAEPVKVSLADVEPVAVKWLWPGRLARGKVTLLAGHAGIGKSILTVDLAARITRGDDWPDGVSGGAPGSVLMLAAEDDAADMLRPRLDAAGGDPSCVAVLKAIRERTGDREREVLPDLVRYIEQIEQALGDETDLLVVDPITAFLGGINSDRDADVRTALAPLVAVAERCGCAILLVAHLRKAATASALHRVGGSVAFGALPRVAWLLAEDDRVSERRILAELKNNLESGQPSLAFKMVNGDGAVAPRLAWEDEPVQTTAEKLLSSEQQEKDSAREVAREWLLKYLANGEVPVKQIEADAEAVGLSWRTVRRAKDDLGIVPRKEGFGPGSKSVWGLP